MKRWVTQCVLALAITCLGAFGAIIGYATVVAVCAATIVDEFPSSTAGVVSERELSSLLAATAWRGFLSHQALNVCEWILGPLGAWGSFSRGYLLGKPLAALVQLLALAAVSVAAGSLAGSWATRRWLRPSYWAALAPAERGGRRPFAAAWRDAGVLFALLPLLGAALAAARIVLTRLDPYPSPLAWPADAVIGAAVLAVAGAARTLAVNRGIIRRSIGEDRLRCRCDYPLDGLAACPECGAARPPLPARSRLLSDPLRRATRWVGGAAIIAAVAAGLLVIMNVGDLRWRLMLRWNRQPYAPDRSLQLRALASDAVVVRLDDGCGVIACNKPFAYVVQDLRALRKSGPPAWQWLGYRAHLGFATAFWPGRDTPGRIEDAQIATGSFVFDTSTRRFPPFTFTLPLGPHSAELSTYGSLIPEYSDYTFSARVDAAERARAGAPADPAIESLRAMIPPTAAPR